eukprot:s4382_g13.t1
MRRSLSFWVRLCAGFVALSQATSQALLSTGVSGILDPANPFGHHSQTNIALCIGTGVSGAFFCALSESAGLLILQAHWAFAACMVWGIYCIYTWSVVKAEDFLPPWSSGASQGVFESLTGNATWVIVLYSLCLLMFVLRTFGFQLHKLNHFLAAVSGYAIYRYVQDVFQSNRLENKHSLLGVIYTVWSEDGMKGALVYGMLVTNRFQWCTRQTSCEIFFYTFCVHFVVSFDRLTRPVKPFEPSKAPLSGSKVSLVAEPFSGGSLPRVFAWTLACLAAACDQAASRAGLLDRKDTPTIQVDTEYLSKFASLLVASASQVLRFILICFDKLPGLALHPGRVLLHRRSCIFILVLIYGFPGLAFLNFDIDSLGLATSWTSSDTSQVLHLHPDLCQQHPKSCRYFLDIANEFPGDASYPSRLYFDKLRLWYRACNLDDEVIGPLVAGHLYGRAVKVALSLRVPRPDRLTDTGNADRHHHSEPHPKRHAIPHQCPQSCFWSTRPRSGNSGLPACSSSTVVSVPKIDDIKLQVAGDYTRFRQARALALRLSPNRNDDATEAFYGDGYEESEPYEDWYEYEDDAWWNYCEEADAGGWYDYDDSSIWYGC